MAAAPALEAVARAYPAAAGGSGTMTASPDSRQVHVSRFAVLTAALLLAAVALLDPARAAAQTVEQPHRAWLAAGLAGAGSTSDAVDGGVGALAQLVYQRRGHHFALRGLAVGDVYGSSAQGLGELGLLYGRAITTGSGHAALAAGLAGVGFETCPDDDDSCFTFGVPVVAELGLSLEFIGVGLQAFANLNPKATYGGVALFLQLGWL